MRHYVGGGSGNISFKYSIMNGHQKCTHLFYVWLMFKAHAHIQEAHMHAQGYITAPSSPS